MVYENQFHRDSPHIGIVNDSVLSQAASTTWLTNYLNLSKSKINPKVRKWGGVRSLNPLVLERSYKPPKRLI